jgi:fatty acid desaturase
MDNDYIASRCKFAIFWRLHYIVTNVALPIYKFGFTAEMVGLILLMGVAESLALAVLFSLSHNFENADRNPTKEFVANGQPICWYKSQVETSCTYGGFISGCFTGGLNFQIEHHVVPRMSSAYYPYIASTVRSVCKKHKVQYVYYPWVVQNLWSTLKYIHAAGTGSNWKDNNPLSGKL